MRRRDVLRWLGAGAAGAALLQRSGPARAFGDAPPSAASLLPPGAERPQNLLECFLYGGLTTWETFYAVEEFGRPDDPDPALRNTQLYAFHNPASDLLDQALAKCGPVPALFTPFATDAAGTLVNLGPMAAPLLSRPDVLARTRVVVTRHKLQPHEAAIPYALTGKPLGTPAAASLGAHIQRFAREHGAPDRVVPYAYTLTSSLVTGFVPTDNFQAALATGVHPGTSRPLLIKVDHAERLSKLLGREGFSKNLDRARHDLLLGAYEAQFEKRLRWPGQGAPVRARAFDELVASDRSVAGAEALRQVLDPNLFVGVSGTVCGDTHLNAPAMSLALAARLLTHPETPAAHVCFIDPGLVLADTGGGYDSHLENSHTQSRNFKNTLTELLARIKAPGEDDPSKIDLDRTMVVLNMEFGRSPGVQGTAGRNHWPYGYVQVYLGGLITGARAGVSGAIGPDGHATVYTTPPEHRIACLLALGIWPFGPEAFGVSDVPGATHEADAAALSLQRVLGYG